MIDEVIGRDDVDVKLEMPDGDVCLGGLRSGFPRMGLLFCPGAGDWNLNGSTLAHVADKSR